MDFDEEQTRLATAASLRDLEAKKKEDADLQRVLKQSEREHEAKLDPVVEQKVGDVVGVASAIHECKLRISKACFDATFADTKGEDGKTVKNLNKEGFMLDYNVSLDFDGVEARIRGKEHFVRAAQHKLTSIAKNKDSWTAYIEEEKKKRSQPIHVFVDHSNILWGGRTPGRTMSVNRMLRVVEGLRDAKTRFAAGSHRQGQGSAWETQYKRLGYTTSSQSRAPGQGEIHVDDAIQNQARKAILQFKSQQAVQTLCLVTGDGNENKGLGGFPEIVQSCLLENDDAEALGRGGWKIEIWAWNRSTSRVYFDFEEQYPSVVRVRNFDAYQDFVLRPEPGHVVGRPRRNPEQSPGRPRRDPEGRRQSPGRPCRDPGGRRQSPGRPRRDPGGRRQSPGRPRRDPGGRRQSPGRPRCDPEGPSQSPETIQGQICFWSEKFGFVRPDIGGANVYFKTRICYPGAKMGDYVETSFTTDRSGRRRAVSIRRSRRRPSPGPGPGPAPRTDSTRGTILSKNAAFGFIRPDIGGANVYFKNEICYPGAQVGDCVETTFTTDQNDRRSAVSIRRSRSPGRPVRNRGGRGQGPGCR